SRHTRFARDWSPDVCSSDLGRGYLDPHPDPVTVENINRLITEPFVHRAPLKAQLRRVDRRLDRPRRPKPVLDALISPVDTAEGSSEARRVGTGRGSRAPCGH